MVGLFLGIHGFVPTFPHKVADFVSTSFVLRFIGGLANNWIYFLFMTSYSYSHL